jgi:5-(carboxyamino)imidazole ribonucleotide mutase
VAGGSGNGPVVGIVGGSRSDFPVLERARAVLDELEVKCELRVVSAHRTPDHLFRYAETAASRGIRVIVAGAGGAAHLPGMLAAKTTLPVIGVPIPTEHLGGLDSLLSIVQMPRGIPVATVAIGNADNAALLAAQILALSDEALRERLASRRAAQTALVMDDESNDEPLPRGSGEP